MRSAFTLIEVLLVLALIAAVAALTWPALDRPLATQRLRRAAEQVRTEITKARTQAILNGETYAFTFQPGKSLMRIDARTQNEAQLESVGTMGGMGNQSSSLPTSTPVTSGPQPARPVEHELPEGIAFYGGEVASDARSDQFAAQERMKGSIDLNWSQPVFLYPDGTASAARIAVVGDRGRAIVVEVRRLTAGVKIGDVISVEELRR